MVAAYAAGASFAAIGREFGRDPTTVAAALHRAGVPLRPSAPTVRQHLEAGTHPGDLPDMDAVVAAYQSGLTTTALAARLGVSQAAVTNWLRAWGADLRRAGVPPRPDGPAIVAAYVAGESTAAIARRLGLSTAGVAVLLRRAGVVLRGPKRRSQAEADAIIAAYVAGASYTTVAAAFNTSTSRVWQLVHNRRAASSAWDLAHPDYDRNYFRREVKPRLGTFDTITLVYATGLAPTYCARIKRGEVEPHAMYWGAIARAVGIEPPAPFDADTKH
jgi:DNA-directed RNA polymerase specialized sigma24 family protein